MNRLATVVLLTTIFALVAGCSQKKVATIDPSSAGSVQTADTTTGAESRKTIPVESVVSLDKDHQDSVPAYVKALQAKLEDMYFAYDKYNLSDEAKAAARNLADVLAKNSTVKVTIEGHCDERGTNEYNLALGDRRAKAAKEYLVALGIPSGRVEIISYGEEKPACSESGEACWAKNRRDHAVLAATSR